MRMRKEKVWIFNQEKSLHTSAQEIKDRFLLLWMNSIRMKKGKEKRKQIPHFPNLLLKFFPSLRQSIDNEQKKMSALQVKNEKFPHSFVRDQKSSSSQCLDTIQLWTKAIYCVVLLQLLFKSELSRLLHRSMRRKASKDPNVSRTGPSSRWKTGLLWTIQQWLTIWTKSLYFYFCDYCDEKKFRIERWNWKSSRENNVLVMQQNPDSWHIWWRLNDFKWLHRINHQLQQ